jgi:hypothetical protein
MVVRATNRSCGQKGVGKKSQEDSLMESARYTHNRRKHGPVKGRPMAQRCYEGRLFAE